MWLQVIKHQNYNSINKTEDYLSVSEEPRGWQSRAAPKSPQEPKLFSRMATPCCKRLEDAVCLYSRQSCHHKRERMDVGLGNEPSLLHPSSTKNMKGITMCHPKICHFGRRILLSWRQLRKSRHRKSSLSIPPHLPKSLTWLVKVSSSLIPGRKEQPLSPEVETAPRWVCIN